MKSLKEQPVKKLQINDNNFREFRDIVYSLMKWALKELVSNTSLISRW